MQRDYEILETIGQGGFATVFRTRNRLDNTEYAIKEIVLKMKKKSFTDDIAAVLNEIRFLAKIKNDNVVRYNHSWVEVELNEKDNDHPIVKEENKLLSSWQSFNLNCDGTNESFELSYIGDDEEYGRITFESKDFVKIDFEHEQDSITIDRTKKRSVSQMENKKEIIINKCYYDIKEIKTLRVYIQMELCIGTLGDFIQNNHMTESEAVRIFLNIMKGITHLHDKEMIIHRDIKPNNIFLTQNSVAKIGDFGLATEIYNMKYKNKNKSRKSSEISGNTATTQNTHSQRRASFHTKNIGTVQYASPEQLNENYYDEKSDIFSLGLVLFEMLTPMTTGMEKHTRFTELKKYAKIPDSIIKRYPVLANLILRMVNVNPILRPSANEILAEVENHMTSLKNKIGLPSNACLNEDESITEVFFKFEDESQLRKMYIKIIQKILLILPEAKSNKATYAYNLEECEIVHDTDKALLEIDHPILNKLIFVQNEDMMEKIKNVI